MNTNGMSYPEEVSTLLSATERAIAALWVEVLDMSTLPGADENFFELGGDSIAMVTLLFRIQEEFSVELPSGAVFGAPSVRELSAMVDSSMTNPDGGAVGSSQADG